MDKHDSINPGSSHEWIATSDPRPGDDGYDDPGQEYADVAAVASPGQTVFLETTMLLTSDQMDAIRSRLDAAEKRTGVHLILMQGARVARITIPAASE